MKDDLIIGGQHFTSRFILGSGKFSVDKMKEVLVAGGVEMATLAVRRANPNEPDDILQGIPSHIKLLPNTSGARNAEEALRIARLVRALGCGDFIKIEIIRDARYLLPDNYETLKAIDLLAKENFIPMPYMYPDLTVARDMRDAGAAAIMPLGSPIGSNKGLCTKDFIELIVKEIDLPIIVDAGIGKPSQACEAMEMGCAAVMANTAIATSGNIAQMAKAFSLAIQSGRLAYLSGLGRVKNMEAEASSPLTGFLDALLEE